MLVLRTTPVGIDKAIQELQVKLHDALAASWGNIKFYGRCYRNRKDNGFVAEVYLGNKEYKEVYYDDAYSATCFFGISDSIEIADVNRANVHLVFFVNLDLIKASSEQRADEEVRTEVAAVLDAGLSHSILQSIDLGVERCLREYPGNTIDGRLKHVDMHPKHCFRFNLEVQYENKTGCEAQNNF